jgi:diphthine-ammonia ligase
MSKLTGCSWSGGKDSCFALMQSIYAGYTPAVLVNMMNENGKISRSHGLPLSILQQQANAMDLPIIATSSTWADYEKNFVHTLQHIKKVYGIDAMVFGDIDLQAHRDWEEMVCRKAELEAVLPIWQQDRKKLILQMLEAGIETMIVSCNTLLGEVFLGKILSHQLIPQLEEKGVDVCGENGEFHTVVFNCPLFKKAIELPTFITVLHNDYWFIQWQDSIDSKNN